MPGLYLHVPFCKQACHYCNFHFSTSLRLKGPLVEAMTKEIRWRAGYLSGRKLTSIYFGGGTPSLLSAAELDALFEVIYDCFEVAPEAEVTLEANPDDLSAARLAELRATPVNRLSIGVQSFQEADLRYMNRAHNAGEARHCLDLALAAGFHDITIDLIYGAPTTTDAHWQENMAIAFAYGLPHLSCYALTVEPRTALDHQVKHGQSAPIDDEQAGRQFLQLMDAAATAGYEHYEISNFALPGRHARHNSSYWLGEPYLGVGPAAHSFDGASRQWNVANNARYVKWMEALDAAHTPWDALAGSLFEREQLSAYDRYNEYVLTRLRTHWGCRIADVEAMSPALAAHLRQQAQPFVAEGEMELRQGVYYLSQAGRLMADGIAAALFADAGEAGK